jgi:hypothetical protein
MQAAEAALPSAEEALRMRAQADASRRMKMRGRKKG